MARTALQTPTKIEGLDELIEGLTTLPSRLQRKRVLARALRKGAEPIRVQAGQNAPRGDEPPHMADSMVIAIREQTSTGAVAHIGPSRNAYYGRFVELGTIHQEAQPFLLPAFKAKLSAAIAAIGAELATQIEREAKKGQRR